MNEIKKILMQALELTMDCQATKNLQMIRELIDHAYEVAGDNKEQRKEIHDFGNLVQRAVMSEYESAH